MSSKIFQEITAEKIEQLKLAFSTSRNVFWNEEKKELIHAGEYGVFREKAVINLLNLYTSEQFGIGAGFIITSQNSVSTQCDIIVYDKLKTPRVSNESHQSFYPIETVVAVGEVKSNIDSQNQLGNHLDKLSQIKALREEIPEASPYRMSKERDYRPDINPFDQIYSFLICMRFKFTPDLNTFLKEDEERARFRHNAVISIEDGIYTYKTNGGPPIIHYPIANGKINDPTWINANNDTVPIHFRHFLATYYNALNVVTLLDLDLVHYIEDNPSIWRP